MAKPDDHKIWKLDMLAEASKRVLEKEERIDHREVESSWKLPEWLVNVMMREENAYEPKLIIERTLYQSDLSKGPSRLAMPLNQVKSDFLTVEEKRIIYEQSRLKTRKDGVSVVLVDPLLHRHRVDLRKWKIGGCWNYVVGDGWNDVVASNSFEVLDVTRIWSFRYGRGKLCLALSPPVRDSTHSGRRSSRRS